MWLVLWVLCVACDSNPLNRCEQEKDPAECLQRAVLEVGGVNEASPLCSRMTDDTLRGECFFLISDGYQLIGEQARTLCVSAVPYTEDCLRHAAARDVEQNIFPTLTHASPQPMKLMPRIYGVVQQYLPAQVAESMSRDMMIRFQASKVSDSFSREACTGLNPSICAQVYIIASLGSRDQWSAYFEEPWMKACGNKLTVSSAVEWGWKSWNPTMDPVVQQAYQQICNAVEGSQPRLEQQEQPAANTDSSK